jgi:hypothetical protein
LSNKDFTIVVNGQLHALVALPQLGTVQGMRRERFLATARIQTLIGWLSSPCPVTIPNCVIPAPNMEYDFLN